MEKKISRNEIRVVDVPKELFKYISDNAKKNIRSNGNELIFMAQELKELKDKKTK